MTEVHENQKTCGNSIIKAFVEEGKSHVLLLAQMQMGKSGTYWHTILNMIFMNVIENVVLMSGNRESELYQQVLGDKKAYIKWFLSQTNIVGSLSVPEKKSLKNKFRKNIQIVWGGQLCKKNKGPFDVLDNTLIVWDEAHYAQSENNAPDKFFKHNNLHTLVNGSVSHTRRNILLLTVSATPFSELVVNASEEKSFHKVIKLIPDKNYCGLEHYMTKQLIHNSFVINEENMDLFKQIIVKHNVLSDPKYMIVRVTDNKKKQMMISKVCKELKVAYKYYNSTIKDIDLDDMVEKPAVSTVIIISGMLRMGKVIHKDHISMVFEASTKNCKRKVDTGLQGLLGRVCGYSKTPSGFDIAAYVEDSIIDEIKQYIANYNSKNGPYCSNAMNTRSGLPETKKLHKYNVFELPIENGFLTEKMNICKPKVIKWLKNNFMTLNMTDTVSQQFNELLETNLNNFVTKNLTTKCNTGLNRLVQDNYHSSYITIPSDKYYLLNNNTQMWLVFNINDDGEAEKTEDEEEEDIMTTDNIFVLNKCVFKNHN
uniref:Uncharacterized protein n=1 Tax=Pyramimonas orientalis virus TaxID=455367 RepID=A0A7M3UPA4_POV01|nr:hypothetical protein HWQ62_00450 [Pyramimonas orientalis virus]